MICLNNGTIKGTKKEDNCSCECIDEYFEGENCGTKKPCDDLDKKCLYGGILMGDKIDK